MPGGPLCGPGGSPDACAKEDTAQLHCVLCWPNWPQLSYKFQLTGSRTVELTALKIPSVLRKKVEGKPLKRYCSSLSYVTQKDELKFNFVIFWNLPVEVIKVNASGPEWLKPK